MRLTLLTLNVWFDERDMARRTAALGELIAVRCPDVLALQEVTDEALAMMRLQRWFARYYVSKRPANGCPYFTLLAVRARPAQVQRVPFQSSVMGRDLLVANVAFASASGRSARVTLATTHLESTRSYAAERRRQLLASLALLSPPVQGTQTALLFGDMNLGPGECSDAVAQPWCDCWLALAGHDEANGATFDARVNPYCASLGSYRARLDRVFLRDSAGDGARVVKMERVGCEELAPGLWLSDHFGLWCELVVRSES